MHERNINNKPEARIENWIHVGGVLFGNVKNHYRQEEFNPDSGQRTSRVQRYNEAEGWAETRNTFYILGNKV